MRALDGDAAGEDRGRSSVVADGDVFVIGQERIIGTEETAYAGCVVNGSVEVGVVRNVNGFQEGRASDRVESGFGGLAASRFGIDVEESDEGFAEKRPGARAESHEWIEDGSLAGGGEAGRQESGGGAGVKIEQMGSDGGAEARLAVE